MIDGKKIVNTNNTDDDWDEKENEYPHIEIIENDDYDEIEM